MHMYRRMTILAFLGIAMLLLATGCGSSSSSSAPPVVSSGNTYLVEYIPGTSPAGEGKTTFQLKIRKSADGSLATGLTPTLVPTMHMTGGMAHGTPVDVVTETVPGTSGVYNCTIYYLMGDHMMMTLMGYWELQVKIGVETATFYPSVGSQMMGADTWKTSMQSTADMSSSKKYYLFSDGMVSAASPTFLLYISRAENNPPTLFTPISAVSGPSGTVASVVVTASTDTAFTLSSGATVTATDNGNGHFSMPGLDALKTAGSYSVFVKLNVNGEDKLVSGQTYTWFNVTSH